jgi:hypothetical protein
MNVAVLMHVKAALPWTNLRGQVVLGTEGFPESMRRFFAKKADLSEVARRQRYAPRPALGALFAKASKRRTRDAAIHDAYVKHGYTLVEIGRHPGLHYTMISKSPVAALRDVMRNARHNEPCDSGHALRLVRARDSRGPKLLR